MMSFFGRSLRTGWVLLLALGIAPAVGCDGGGTAGDGSETRMRELAESNPDGLNFALEFEAAMDTAHPAGTEVAGSVLELLGPSSAHATYLLQRSLFFPQYPSLLLLRAVWISNTVLFVMISTRVPDGQVRVVLNPNGVQDAFRIAGGVALPRQEIRFDWRLGLLPLVPVRVDF